MPVCNEKTLVAYAAKVFFCLETESAWRPSEVLQVTAQSAG